MRNKIISTRLHYFRIAINKNLPSDEINIYIAYEKGNRVDINYNPISRMLMILKNNL